MKQLITDTGAEGEGATCACCGLLIRGRLCKSMFGEDLHWGCSIRRSPSFARTCEVEAARRQVETKSAAVAARFRARKARKGVGEIPAQRAQPALAPLRPCAHSSRPTNSHRGKDSANQLLLAIPDNHSLVMCPSGARKHSLSQRRGRTFYPEGAEADMFRGELNSDWPSMGALRRRPTQHIQVMCDGTHVVRIYSLHL